MSAIHVFFFRGLSTYGHDSAKWSILDFGPMHRHLATAFAQREVQFHPVLGMGAGSIPEISSRALQFLDQHPVWRDPKVQVHFLGHSAGGLVAKWLLKDPVLPRGKVLSCMTLATPHRGTQLAELALNMPEKYPGSARILKFCGYNISTKNGFFEELTPRGVTQLFGEFATVADLSRLRTNRIASIVCSAPRAKWCLPLKMFYSIRAFRELQGESDGLIERDSQPYGEVIAEMDIDHFRQLGFFGEPQLFNQLCDVLREFFADTQRQS